MDRDRPAFARLVPRAQRRSRRRRLGRWNGRHRAAVHGRRGDVDGGQRARRAQLRLSRRRGDRCAHGLRHGRERGHGADLSDGGWWGIVDAAVQRSATRRVFGRHRVLERAALPGGRRSDRGPFCRHYDHRWGCALESAGFGGGARGTPRRGGIRGEQLIHRHGPERPGVDRDRWGSRGASVAIGRFRRHVDRGGHARDGRGSERGHFLAGVLRRPARRRGRRRLHQARHARGARRGDGGRWPHLDSGGYRSPHAIPVVRCVRLVKRPAIHRRRASGNRDIGGRRGDMDISGYNAVAAVRGAVIAVGADGHTGRITGDIP